MSTTVNRNQSFSGLVGKTRQQLVYIRDEPSAIEPAIKDWMRNIRKMNAVLKTVKSVG